MWQFAWEVDLPIDFVHPNKKQQNFSNTLVLPAETKNLSYFFQIFFLCQNLVNQKKKENTVTVKKEVCLFEPKPKIKATQEPGSCFGTHFQQKKKH